MGSVAEFFRGIVKSTAIFFQKVGTFLLAIFFVGMLVGGYIIARELSLLWFAAFAISIVVMWNDFGEGIGILLLFLILLIFFPQVLPMITL